MDWPHLAAVDSRNFFNWIDFLVVCSSWTELFAAALPISPTFLRMLRLGKLLRALRVVKMSQVKMGQGMAGHGRADFAPQLQFLIANHVASLELRV